ncbi:hypothetical protein, conserved [Eimeria maxima]|uniref:Uncharacterized protein n=1 Tax=Eimeria maxima TaxID=5804 RepID=U6M5V3_EIMMA|nr:hypothetical protein, conserved [Eimeria maxima]CDJ58458.1 hypothetical protein, conserved [Eimeria maxima]
MKGQQSPAPPSAGVAQEKTVNSTASDVMLSLEAAQTAANIDVGVSLYNVPQASVHDLRRCAPTSRTCITIAVITFTAVAFLISACARHLKLHLDLSATNQTRHLAAGTGGPCYPSTAGGFLETVDPIAFYYRQIQALSITQQDAVHLTHTENRMVGIAKGKLVNLNAEIEKLQQQIRFLNGSIARLQEQLRTTSRTSIGPLRIEMQNVHSLIEKTKFDRDSLESQLQEKQRLLAASVWSRQQEADALIIKSRDRTGNLTIGAARALAATKVVVAEGSRTREVHTQKDLLVIEALLKKTLANAAFLSDDLKTQRPSSRDSVEKGKALLQDLDNFAIALPFVGLRDHVNDVLLTKDRLRGSLSMTADSIGTGYMERAREGNAPQPYRSQGSSTIVRRHTMSGENAYPRPSSHGANYGTLPRVMRHESFSPGSGAHESTHALPATLRPPPNVSLSRSSYDLRPGNLASAFGARESTRKLPAAPSLPLNVSLSRSLSDVRRGSWSPASGARGSTHTLPATPRLPSSVSLSRSSTTPGQYRQPLHQPQRTLPQGHTTALPKRLPLADPPKGSKITPTVVSIPVVSSRDVSQTDNPPLPSGPRAFPLYRNDVPQSSSLSSRPKPLPPSSKKSPGVEYMMPSSVVTSAAKQPSYPSGLLSLPVVGHKKHSTRSTSNGHSPSLTQDSPSSPPLGPAGVQPERSRLGQSPIDGDPSTPSGPSKAEHFPGPTEGGGASEGDDLQPDKREGQRPEPGGDQQQPGGSSPPPGEPSSALGGQPSPPGDDPPPPSRPPFTKGEPSGADETDLDSAAQELSVKLELFIETAEPVASAKPGDPVLSLYGEVLLKDGLQLLRQSDQLISAFPPVQESGVKQELVQQREQCVSLCRTLSESLAPLWATSLRSKLAVLEDVTRQSADQRTHSPTDLPNGDYVQLLEKIQSLVQESREAIADFAFLNAPPVQSSQVSALLSSIEGAITEARAEVHNGVKFCAVEWKAALEHDAETASTESLRGAHGPVEAPSLPFKEDQSQQRPPAGFLEEVDLLVSRVEQLVVCQQELDALRAILTSRRSGSSKT